jgi:UDP-N-acetylglucosamine 4,6-dehydratase/5-epimerase
MNWSEQAVLVTGGTGSFGRKFVEIMLKEHRPKRLVIFSRDELKQHDMRASGLDHPSLRYFIGDVRDPGRLERALAEISIVVHAAALKQVPACEYNPFEAIQTNIMGGRNVIDAAINQGVRRVLALSTDKAVNPINLYGATKLCAEKMFVQANAYAGAQDSRFSCARYGNVVGSRGSVIPVFQEQRRRGRITLTDPRMTRFWLTLEQGVRFVVSSIEQMHGGEIFVPKIPSMRMVDLAESIAPGCEIETIGIRPGEKLHEVLVSEDEARNTLEVEDRYIIQPSHPWWRRENWVNGRPLPEGFRYASDNNEHWLTNRELQELISPGETEDQLRIASMSATSVSPQALAINGGSPVRATFLPYGRQSVDEADIQAVVDVLRSDWLTTGPKVGEFEEAFASRVGAAHAVSFSSGTAALHAAAFAAGLKSGDEAITSPLTFAATANCVLYQGATPVFADVSGDTLNLDPEQVSKKISSRTRAILPVDYAGHPADLKPILEIARQNGLIVIEDACHALGAEYRGHDRFQLSPGETHHDRRGRNGRDG